MNKRNTSGGQLTPQHDDKPTVYVAGASHAIRETPKKVTLEIAPAGEVGFDPGPATAIGVSSVDGVRVQHDTTDKPAVFSRDEFARRVVPSGPTVATPAGEPQRSK